MGQASPILQMSHYWRNREAESVRCRDLPFVKALYRIIFSSSHRRRRTYQPHLRTAPRSRSISLDEQGFLERVSFEKPTEEAIEPLLRHVREGILQGALPLCSPAKHSARPPSIQQCLLYPAPSNPRLFCQKSKSVWPTLRHRTLIKQPLPHRIEI